MIGLYLDEHMSDALAEQLRRRSVNVVMAKEVGMIGKDDDSEHLPYATERKLALVTRDKPFANRTTARTDFFSFVYLTGDNQKNIGRQVEALYEFVQLFDEERDVAHVFWYPV